MGLAAGCDFKEGRGSVTYPGNVLVGTKTVTSKTDQSKTTGLNSTKQQWKTDNSPPAVKWEGALASLMRWLRAIKFARKDLIVRVMD